MSNSSVLNAIAKYFVQKPLVHSPPLYHNHLAVSGLFWLFNDKQIQVVKLPTVLAQLCYERNEVFVSSNNRNFNKSVYDEHTHFTVIVKLNCTFLIHILSCPIITFTIIITIICVALGCVGWGCVLYCVLQFNPSRYLNISIWQLLNISISQYTYRIYR